jgi:hypothetical protein
MIIPSGQAARILILREGFLDGGVDGEELGEAGDLDDGVALLGKGGKGKAFASVSAVDKQLHQGADSGGVQKGNAAHIEDEVGRGFGAQSLNEIVNGFEAELAGEPDDEAVRVGCGQFFQFEMDGLHKGRSLAQKWHSSKNFLGDASPVRE